MRSTIRWFFLLALATQAIDATAGQYGFSIALQYSKLAPAYGESVGYSLTPGLRYQEEDWYLSGSLPILFQKQDTLSRVGGGVAVPAGSSMGSSSGHMGSSGIRPGLGDFVLAASTRVHNEEDCWMPSVWPLIQIKAPTSMGGFGTGKWDFGLGASFKRIFLDFLTTFLDLTYVLTGDPSGKTYKNPFFYSAGLGPIFGDGSWSLLFAFQGSTPIETGTPGQRQLSLGTNIRINPSLFLSALIGHGLSDSTPRHTTSVGLSMVW